MLILLTIAKNDRSTLATEKYDSRYADEKGRQYFYDNAKFILIFLVVLAHAISPFKTDGDGYIIFNFLWRSINTLHMPCLIFISGFFAKSYIKSDGTIKVQRLFTYIVYYVVAQLTVGAFEVFVLGNSIAKSMLAPRSSLWFLLCLISWYIILPIVEKIRPEIMFPVAIVVGLLIGYDEKVSNFMAISRVITHFPFFLLGYYITGETMNKLRTKKAKLISIPVILAAVGSILLIMYLFSSKGPLNFSINSFITCDKSYFKIFDDKGINPLLWFLPRVWFYLCATALGFGFLVWVPKRKNIFTKFGSRTLAVYILHRYLYLAYLEYGWYNFEWLGMPWLTENYLIWLRVGVIVVSFILTVLLSTYPFYLPFKLLGKIKIDKLLRR